MSVLIENGHINEHPFNHARILYGNVIESATATGEAVNFPASASITDTTYDRWSPLVSGDSITYSFSAQNINAISISAHSDLDFTIEVRSSGGVYESITAYPAEGSSLESNFAEQDYALINYSPDNETVLFLIKDRFADSIRITVTYSGDTPTIGNVRAGNILEMQRPFYQGHSPSMLAPKTTLRPNISEAGEWLGASLIRQGRELSFSWENLKAPWVRKNWVSFAQALKTEPYVIAWNPLRFPADCFYATSSSVPKPTNSGPLNYQSITLNGRGYSDGTDPVVENLAPSTFAEQYTFTRNSEATYYDIGGVLRTAAIDEARFDHEPVTGESLGLLIEEQRTNLLNYSENPEQSPEGVSNAYLQPHAEVTPSGNLRATQFNEEPQGGDAQYNVQQNVTVSATPTEYSYSVYLKEGSRRYVEPRITGVNTGDRAEAVIDMNTGTFLASPNAAGGFSNVSGELEDVGGGWYRLKISFTNDSSTVIRCYLYPNDDGVLNSGTVFTSTGENFFYTKEMLEEGAFPTSYTPSTDSFTSRASTATFYDSAGVLQTAAIDVARDDAYGWLDGVLYPIGLLLEGAATNLATWSEQIDDPSWSKINSSVTADAIAAPDGAVTGDKLVEDSTNNVHYFRDTYSFTSGTTYTISVFAKAAERTFAYLFFSSVAFPQNPTVYFDLENGTVAGTDQNPEDFGIEFAGDGWYRCYMTATADASLSAEARVGLALGDGQASYQGDGTSGAYFWGVQLETGNYPTSYTGETTASTVTRSADVSSSAQTTREADDCVRTLGAEFNAEAFTFYIEAVRPYESAADVAEGNPFLFEFYDPTTDSRLNWFAENGSEVIQLRISGVTTINITPFTAVLNGDTLKAAVSLQNGVLNYAVNGFSGTQTFSGELVDYPELQIADTSRASNREITGTVQDTRLFPRAYTAAELEDLTGG